MRCAQIRQSTFVEPTDCQIVRYDAKLRVPEAAEVTPVNINTNVIVLIQLCFICRRLSGFCGVGRYFAVNRAALVTGMCE